MNSIKSHTYLIGYAKKDDERVRVYMKPTAKNIANFIMKNDIASIIITDEMDLPVVTAECGFIYTCRDRDFLINELQPAIIPIQTGEKPVGEIEEFDINAVCNDFD